MLLVLTALCFGFGFCLLICSLEDLKGPRGLRI